MGAYENNKKQCIKITNFEKKIRNSLYCISTLVVFQFKCARAVAVRLLFFPSTLAYEKLFCVSSRFYMVNLPAV